MLWVTLQVTVLEQDQAHLVTQRQHEIAEKYRRAEPNIDMTQGVTQEFILREISSTLAQRKKLHNQVSRLESELVALEKISEERKQAQILAKPQAPVVKASRKAREYRTRSQDWPDVPDIGKIEEQNPEILAQKILETGRKIEASKMVGNKSNFTNIDVKERNLKNHIQMNQRPIPRVNNNMPAPVSVSKRCTKVAANYSSNRTSEPPRVVNFEDRLKSIITSVLNEDLIDRSKQTPNSNKYNNASSNTTTTTTTSSSTGSTTNSTHSKSKVPYHGNDYNQNVPPNKVDEKLKDHHLDLYMNENKSSEIYNRAEHVSHPLELDNKLQLHQEGLVASVMESYRKEAHPEVTPREPLSTSKQLTVEQPDYTQVSPAKLALRRHLSQEKLAAQQPIQYQHHDGGIVAARTIGDLMSGEIERTLEISNQSIINAAVDMSDIHGTTTVTSRSVMNQNIPPRPERVNVKVLNVDTKEQEPVRQIYSPISRPSSTEGSAENLVYMHYTKQTTNPSAALNHTPHLPNTVPPQQTSPRTTVLYPPSMNNCMYKVMPSRTAYYPASNDQYTPLPRADIKPYHESYFTDTKPPVSLKMVENNDSNKNFIPEGLAATLHARVLNAPVIKEEVDESRLNRECNLTERRNNFTESKHITPASQPGTLPYQNESVMQNIKTEVCDNAKSPASFQYLSQKRVSPIIQGPIRTSRKLIDGNEEMVNNVAHRQQLPANVESPESHSNTSTPLVDEVPDRDRRLKPEEGRNFLILFLHLELFYLCVNYIGELFLILWLKFLNVIRSYIK